MKPGKWWQIKGYEAWEVVTNQDWKFSNTDAGELDWEIPRLPWSPN